MLGSTFAKSLRDQRWALLGWGIGIGLLVFTAAAVWPTMRDLGGFRQFLDSYPKAMRKLFNLDAMATGTGFMNAELFTLMLPMLFIIYGVTRGARSVAGEEESGVLEPVLVSPVPARRLVLEKVAALGCGVAVLGLVLSVVLLLGSVVFDLGIGPGDAVTGALSMVLLGFEFGCVALAVGAVTGRRAVALGAGGAAAVGAYVLYALGLIVDSVQPWQPLSPFRQALGDGPLGVPPAPSLVWVVLGAAVVTVACIPLFDRRDLRTH
jgi:ABC-2 type transport system permease protein